MYTTDSAAGHPHEASISDWQNRYGYQPLGWTEDIENQPIPGIGDEDMAISDQDAQKIAEKVWGYNYNGAAPGGNMFNLLVYELAHLVWAYKNSKVNGDKDAYRLLTETQNLPHDTWAYKNSKVNGDDDVYRLLTEIHQQLGRIIDQKTTTGIDQ